MARCKACDTLYTLKRRDPSGNYEELCNSCLIISRASIYGDDEIIGTDEDILDELDMRRRFSDDY